MAYLFENMYFVVTPHRVSATNGYIIRDMGDGGAKQDKFLRDIRLLEQSI